MWFLIEFPILTVSLPNECHTDANALCPNIAVTRLLRWAAVCSHHQSFLPVHFKNTHNDCRYEYSANRVTDLTDV